MGTEILNNITAIYVAVFAWDTIWLQITVLPFFNKGDNLHKDYIQSGSKDLCIASIENRKLIKPIAKLYTEIRENLPDKRQKLTESEVEDVINNFEYQAHLDEIESGLQCKRKIEKSHWWQKKVIPLVWVSGLIHIIATAVFPALYHSKNKNLDDFYVQVFAYISISSFIIGFIFVLVYKFVHGIFIDTIEKYGNKSS